MTRAKNNGTQPLRQRLYRSRASNPRVAKQEKHPDERDERRLIVFRQTRIDSPRISTRLYQRNNDGAEPGLRNISIEHYATLEKHRQGCARRQTQTPSQKSGAWRSEPSFPWASPCAPASMATEQRMPHETTMLHVHMSCEGMLRNRASSSTTYHLHADNACVRTCRVEHIPNEQLELNCREGRYGASYACLRFTISYPLLATAWMCMSERWPRNLPKSMPIAHA